jgi:flagellar biogenesis protein FliO
VEYLAAPKGGTASPVLWLSMRRWLDMGEASGSLLTIVAFVLLVLWLLGRP